MVHGALVFHRKYLGKKLGYKVVFVEECSMGMCSSWVHCTQCKSSVATFLLF